MSFKRILDKLDNLDARLDSVDKTLVKQEGQLAEHMKRSEANEKALDVLKDEIKPILSHIEAMKLIGKTILALGGLAAATLSVIELIKLFS